MKRLTTLTFALALMISTVSAQSYNALFYTASSQNSIIADISPEVQNYEKVVKEIEYPAAASENFKEAFIQVTILVDQKGNYTEHFYPSENESIFEEAINKEISKLTFSPARKNGKAVMAWITVPFKFSLID